LKNIEGCAFEKYQKSFIEGESVVVEEEKLQQISNMLLGSF
jgi:hypothetical protein